tara:strand:- start:180 stop:533 length:354 start_codon:yes stop_codon:yes gene_type:complete
MDAHGQNLTRITQNINAGRDPVLGIGSMASVNALFAHDFPADITPKVKSALEARLAKYIAQGKADKSAQVKLTQKALAFFTPAPTAKQSKPAPSRKTKADLQAQLDQAMALIAKLQA